MPGAFGSGDGGGASPQAITTPTRATTTTTKLSSFIKKNFPLFLLVRHSFFFFSFSFLKI
jgi:hypothetical protein